LLDEISTTSVKKHETEVLSYAPKENVKVRELFVT